MRRFTWILAALALCIFIAPSTPAKAQTYACTLTYDFGLGDQGFVNSRLISWSSATEAGIHTGGNWRSEFVDMVGLSNNWFRFLSISKQFTVSMQVDQIRYGLSRTDGTIIGTHWEAYGVSNSYAVSAYDTLLMQNVNAARRATGTYTDAVNIFISAGQWFNYQHHIHRDNSSPFVTGGELSVSFFEFSGTCGEPEPEPEEFTRPLSAANTHSFDFWTGTGLGVVSDIHATTCEHWRGLSFLPAGACMDEFWRLAPNSADWVYQFPSQANAPVSVVQSGTVIGIQALSTDDCDLMTSNVYRGPPPHCLFEVPSWKTLELGGFVKSETMPYIVSVEHSDGSEMQYMVTDPRASLGTNVTAGCVVGNTIPVTPTSYRSAGVLSARYFTNPTDMLRGNVISQLMQETGTMGNFPTGIASMAYRGTSSGGGVTLGSYETISVVGYRSPGNPCDIEPGFSACTSVNPLFNNNGEYWLASEGVLWLNPGVLIPPGNAITLPNLSLGTASYGGSIQAEDDRSGVIDRFTELTVTVGTRSYSFGLDPVANLFFIPSEVASPNNGTLSDITIRNNGRDDVRVYYFCLNEGGSSEPVTSCLFNNYSFDGGITNWATSAIGVTPTTGALLMYDESWIEQTVQLNNAEGGGAHTYTIKIEVEVPPHLRAGFSMNASHNGGSTIILPLPVFGTSGDTGLITGNFVIGADTLGPFRLNVFIDEGGSPSASPVTVKRVCIEPPYPDQGGGGIYDEPEGCSQIAAPGESVQEHLTWHWENLNKVYNCTIVPILRDTWKGVITLSNNITNQFNYFRQVLYSWTTWAGDSVFPWIAGYLTNISPGSITINQTDTGEGECDSLWCVLTSIIEGILGPVVNTILGFITQVVDFLFSAMTAILSLFLNLFIQIFGLLQTAITLFANLVLAFINAEPISPPGVPDCVANPTESVCVIWYIADNTVLSGDAGEAIIPLLVSIGYVILALYIIGEIKRVLTSTARSF